MIIPHVTTNVAQLTIPAHEVNKFQTPFSLLKKPVPFMRRNQRANHVVHHSIYWRHVFLFVLELKCTFQPVQTRTGRWRRRHSVSPPRAAYDQPVRPQCPSICEVKEQWARKKRHTTLSECRSTRRDFKLWLKLVSCLTTRYGIGKCISYVCRNWWWPQP